jgi:hypothetical protein
MVNPITTSSIKVEVKQYLGKFSKKRFSLQLEPLVCDLKTMSDDFCG